MATLPNPVQQHLVGAAIWETTPGDDPSLYGTATMAGPSVVECRSYQTFRIRYTTGKLGIDDTGGICIAMRMITDSGPLQTQDSTAPNYATAKSSGEGNLEVTFATTGQRPWAGMLRVRQRGGYLKPGETIDVVIGDTSGGSPGQRMSSFRDGGYVFRVMADIQATGVFVPVPDTLLSVAVVAGPKHRYLAVLPTMRRPGEPFHFGVKAEDKWGNPTPQGPTSFEVSSTLPVQGLPTAIEFTPENGAMTLEGLSVAREGELRIALTAPDGTVTESGPLMIRSGENAQFWGDLHGQTGETVGTNTIEHYFDFARTMSFLDVTSHQANDFQINEAFWAHLNTLTAALDEPGRFTVLPGYEWSGNTAVGGDHNVYYAAEGASIYRCSHALVADRSDADTDAHTLTDLYAKLNAEPTDALVYAHVGGRYADIFYDHDPKLEAAVEMHSAWGSFEWILTDGFPLRRRVGVVCNSDGHKGRPGASYPGASVFGAAGGLTCFIMGKNTRPSVFEAVRRRHTYGTTGIRVFMDVSARLPAGGTLYHRDPAAFPDAGSERISACMLGDIVHSDGDTATVTVEVSAPVGIVSLEFRDGSTVLERARPYAADDLGHRVRVLCSGAEYRGRGRNTMWQGRALLTNAHIERFEPVNKLNPEVTLDQTGSRSVIWKFATTGNMKGFDVWLEERPGATIDITTRLGEISLPLAEVGVEPERMDAGGLFRQLTVQRLPDAPLPRTLTLERTVSVAENGDTPLWVCATFEDGNQAWTSPIYLFRDVKSTR